MTYINSTIGKLEESAKEVLAALAEGEELTKLLKDLQNLCRYAPRNTINIRQKIASAISAAGKYAV